MEITGGKVVWGWIKLPPCNNLKRCGVGHWVFLRSEGLEVKTADLHKRSSGGHQKISTTGLSSRQPIWRSELNSPLKRNHMERGHHCQVLGMQIKTPGRYHHTEGRRAIVRNSTNNKCWWRCREKAIWKMSYFMQENLHPCFAAGNRGYSQGPARLVIAQSPKHNRETP